MNKKNIKALIVFRDFLSRNRGTPLRVKSLITELHKDNEIELYTASRDETPPFDSLHLCLSTSNIGNIFLLHKFIKENDVNIVIFHTIAAGYFIPPLWFFGGRYKKVLEMHGFFEEEARLYNDITFLKYHRNRFFYALIYRMCDLITTCSDTARDKLLKYNSNTHSVFGGVDLNLFNPSLHEGNLSDDDDRTTIKIGYAGNGRRWQGLAFLLQAFLELSKRDKSFSLQLLLSEKVNLPEIKNVFVHDALPHNEVWRFNNKCDILVIPRPNNEVNRISFPSKLMEYLASKKPVVGSKTSDIHKIIVHRESGMLYEPGDIEGFVACMLELKNPELRAKLAHNGYELARSKYGWEIQGKLFTNLVKAVV